MPWPAGPIQPGALGANEVLHAWTDATRVGENAVLTSNFMENLYGHRSGGVNKAAPLDASPAAAVAGVYTMGGTSTGTAAGTLTDANQTWPANQWANYGIWAAGQFAVITSNTGTVLTLKANWGSTPGATSQYRIVPLAEQNQGATVTYGAGPANALVDSAKAWTANQWRGYWVMVNGELRQIISNTTTQLTLDKAWAAQPANNQQYGILLPIPGGWDEMVHGVGSTLGVDAQANNTNPLYL